jgi:hypothetical protein
MAAGGEERGSAARVAQESRRPRFFMEKGAKEKRVV